MFKEVFHNYSFLFQSALNINPAALRPGAAPPGPQQTEKAVTFEDPPKAETLTSMTKVRHTSMIMMVN